MNGAVDYCFALGGLVVAEPMDPECDAYKQIEAIVSDSLLSQEFEMGHIKNCIAMNPHYIMINPY